MKRILTAAILCFLIAACGSGKTGTDVAQEICDCYKKANGMKADDPGRIAAQNDCVEKQGDAWTKIRDDQEKSRAFNKKIAECATEQIHSSMGQ